MTFSVAEYQRLRALWSEQFPDELLWAKNIKPPQGPKEFAQEVIYVICNSGMRNVTARAIYEKIMEALRRHQPLHHVFGHAGKCAAILEIWRTRDRLFDQYRVLQTDEARIEWLGDLPWIGPITKFHAAKNFGVVCMKPDRHLARIAKASGETPHDLCARLAAESGDSVPVVDTVLWRAAAEGWVNSMAMGEGP